MVQGSTEDAATTAPAVPENAQDGELVVRFDRRRWWTMIPEMVIALCAGLLPLLMGLNIVSRYTDWFYVFWIDDIVKVLFLWVVFLGGAVATKYDAHVRMAVVSDRIGRMGPLGRIWERFIAFSPIIVGAVLLVLGVQLTQISMRRELPSLRIPAGYFTIVVPLSGALMIGYVLRNQVLAKRPRS